MIQEITPQEWYELLEKIHILENKTNCLLVFIILASIGAFFWCLALYLIELDKKKAKKDKDNDRQTKTKK